MSLLLASGHPQAMHYPLGRVFDEARLVVERRNNELATIGVIIQNATATTGMGANKETKEIFTKLIKGLSGDIE